MTSATDPFNCALSYQWDKSSNLTSLSGGYNSDYGTLQYAYASDGKLPSLTLPDGSVIYYDYDESGHIFQIRYPGSYNDRKMIYAPNDWLTQIQDPDFPGQYSYNYYYNNDGTVSCYSSWAGGDSFGYDSDGRLNYWYYNPSSLSGGSAIQQNYSYDAAGNITNKGGTVYTYNSANEITNSGFTYDKNGNMTSDGNFTYTYNALDQLVQANKVSNGSLVATYTYNHDGTRRSKTTSLGTTDYDWDASGNLVRESTPSGTNYYYYTPSGTLVGFKKNGTTYITHDNQRGDIESVATESGSIVAQYHYDPWGNQVSYSGSVTLPFGYAGYYYDSETGLYYLKSRYYSPVLGRFITRDSHDNVSYTNPQSLDLYTYCGNDPVNHVDPSGNGYVWNNYGEIIGTTSGADITDASQAALDVQGGSQYANTVWNVGMHASQSESDIISNSAANPVPMSDDPSFIAASVVTGGGAEDADAVVEGAESAVKTVGNVITGYTQHGLDSAMAHDGVGVSPSAILDAVRNPTSVIEQTGNALGNAMKYIGQNAVVVLNQAGKVITTWAITHLGWRL